MFEIIVSKIFNSLEQQSGPDLLLFKRFSKFWKNIKKEAYESALSDDSISSDLKLIKSGQFYSKLVEQLQCNNLSSKE